LGFVVDIAIDETTIREAIEQARDALAVLRELLPDDYLTPSSDPDTL